MIFNDSRFSDLFLYGGFDFDLVRYGESFENGIEGGGGGGGGYKGTLECYESPWMIGLREPPLTRNPPQLFSCCVQPLISIL